MSMPSQEWDNASTDKKLVMLRENLEGVFSRLNGITGAVEEIKKQLPKAAKKE